MTSSATDRNGAMWPDVAIKQPVACATTAAITLSGEQTIDGHSAVDGDRVLVKNQSSSVYNGIYIASTGAWTRAADLARTGQVVKGTMVYVTAGTANGGLFYNVTSTDPIDVDTDAIAWAVVSPGTGLSSPVTVAQGGTGSTTAATARTALGAAASGANTDITSTAGAVFQPKNYAVNGSFAVNQDVTAGTTDNSYALDGWRLLLGAANAAIAAQDTADVPTGAGYALKLTVGAGNNNKFGVFCPIENRDMLDLRGGVCSIRVPLKATAGLTDGTGKIRIGIMQWTGTADSVSATPISAWGAEGTNPTLIANWAFANTPAAQTVSTSWADYTVENVSISASATNLGILIWSDDKANTTTTDILRIGGYVTLCRGAAAPVAQVNVEADEWKSLRYYAKTFQRAVAPAQNTSDLLGALTLTSWTGATAPGGIYWQFPRRMRTAPTVTTYNPSAANANWRDVTNSADRTAAVTTSVLGDAGVEIAITAALAAARHSIHATANARL